MIIQFKKSTGEIVASYPEAFGNPIPVSVKENGKVTVKSTDLDFTYLMPLDAHSFEDPRQPDNIHKGKVIVKGGRKIVKYNNAEIPTIDKKDLKSNLRAWKDTWDYLKTQHPDKKIKDAMREEKMII